MKMGNLEPQLASWGINLGITTGEHPLGMSPPYRTLFKAIHLSSTAENTR